MTVRVLSGPFNRDSLFFAEGADWKWQSRAVTPAFRHDNLLALVSGLAQWAQAEVWRKSPAAAPIDVMEFAAIGRTALSAKLHGPSSLSKSHQVLRGST